MQISATPTSDGGGMEPSPTIQSSLEIVMMENHDAAYYAWREQGMKDRLLVHIDDHHDMWWIENSAFVTIANYICPAIQENIVRAVHWIVPDPRWYNPKEKAKLVRQVKRIIKGYPDSARVMVSETEISTMVLGRPFTVQPLALLPHFGEDVLLDIDTDYLLGSPDHDKGKTRYTQPWCRPRELVSRLQSSKVQSDFVTIAYSVEGGYTPLAWKYLGDEIEARLRRSDDAMIRGFDLLHDSAVLLASGERKKAASVLFEADERLAGHAAPQYLLSELCVDDNRIVDSQGALRRAVARDPSYQTAYGNGGLVCLQEKRYSDASRAFQRGLIAEPEDAVNYYGLGCLAAVNKKWEDAEQLLRKALELRGDFLDAHRSLGNVLRHQGRHPEAISAYEKTLRLALAGHKPLDDHIITDTGRLKLSDQHHFGDYARLGGLYAKIGKIDQAINNFRFAIVGKNDNGRIRWELSCLHARRHEWRRCAEHLWNAVRLLPQTLGALTSPAWRRLIPLKLTLLRLSRVTELRHTRGV